MSRLSIVFAPGLMCDARLFEKQAAAIGAERPVLHADLSRDDTIEAMAARLVDAAPDKFYLAGLSMGAIVAFEVWRLARDRVAGLALLNTTPFSDSPARREVRQSQITRVRGGDLATVVMEELKPNYLGSRSKSDQQVLNEIAAMADHLGADVFERQSCALMRRQDSADTLTEIDCPTLIVAGDEDEVCPPELHEIMASAIVRSALHILRDCGHLSTMEAPDRVTTLLKHHIDLTETGLQKS